MDFMEEWTKKLVKMDDVCFQVPNVMSLADWERHGIKTALHECEGNISLAAKKLGITRTTLYRKIDRFGLNILRTATVA